MVLLQFIDFFSLFIYHYCSFKGFLTMTEATLNLTFGAYDMNSVAEVSRDSNSNFNACIKALPMPKFNFTFHYISDMVINKEKPLYGKGIFT